MEWNKALLDRIDQWIAEHRQELVDDTVALIQIRSVSDKQSEVKPFGQGCRDVLEAYIALGEKYGLASRNYEHYVAKLYNPDNSHKKTKIGLMGHLDVVPEGDNWIFPPYEGVVNGDWIIGRGSQDNKGPCLTAMYVVRCLRDLGMDLEYDVVALAGTDEETGMKDAEYYAKSGEVPDLILVTDSGFPICYGERGIVSGWIEAEQALSDEIIGITGGTATNQIPDTAKIILRKSTGLLEKIKTLPPDMLSVEEESVTIYGKGIAAHIAAAGAGVNAIGVLFNTLLQNNLLENEKDRETIGRMAKVLDSKYGEIFHLTDKKELAGDICFGCGMAKLAEKKLQISLNIRCPVTLNEYGVMEQVARYCKNNGSLLIEAQVLPSNYFPKDRPVITKLNEVFNYVTGLNAEPQIFVPGTHARKFKNAVAYGPGIPDKSYYVDKDNLFPEGHGSCHMPDEAQSIPALLAALKIYILGVMALDGQELTKE